MKALALALTATTISGVALNSVLLLDGVNDTAEIADSPSLSGLQQITVEAWFRPSSTAGSSNGIELIVGQFSSLLGQLPYHISYHRTIQRVRVAINEAVGGTFFDGVIPIVEDTWTHAAFTYDGAAVRLYVNGQLDTDRRSSSGPVDESTVPVRIGAQAGSTTNHFAGMIDEARIWNVARTQAEIQGGMRGIPRHRAPGLVGNWSMSSSDLAGQTPDLSGSGNHATLLDTATIIVPDDQPNVVGTARAPVAPGWPALPPLARLLPTGAGDSTSN